LTRFGLHRRASPKVARTRRNGKMFDAVQSGLYTPAPPCNLPNARALRASAHLLSSRQTERRDRTALHDFDTPTAERATAQHTGSCSAHSRQLRLFLRQVHFVRHAVPGYQEKRMISKLLARILKTLIDREYRRRDAYLSAATDLADLERRIKYFESNHAPFSMYYDERPRDRKD
jgi:hypothetical protein